MSSAQVFVKPAKKGLIVRDPKTMKPLSEKGEWKPKDSFWSRRLRDKDVEETTPPAKTKKPTPGSSGGNS